jgi:hypothetical protein
MADPSLTLIDTASGEVVEATRNVLLERIEDLEKDLSNCERDLRRERRRTKALERNRAEERANFEQRQLVTELFEFWQRKTRHARSILTADRFDAIRDALEQGYSARQIAMAFAGIAFDPFCTNSKNGRTERHDDICVALKSGKSLEMYARKAPKRRTPRQS